jgi:pyridoxal phosphate enzyme (YggS family)
LTVLKNWKKVQENIQTACKKSGRSIDEVTVVAVTKYVDVTRIEEAFQAGLQHVGESKAQDAVGKWDELGGKGTWHYIGHLQSNKVKDVIGRFQYIHSLDRLSLAKEIEKKAKDTNTTVKCFIQVNISGESTKHGLAPEEVEGFIDDLSSYSHIKIVGLMTMAPYSQNPEDTRSVFQGLKRLQKKLQLVQREHAPLTELSMGMSNDYVIAIEEGATFIRLGTVLVGE